MKHVYFYIKNVQHKIVIKACYMLYIVKFLQQLRKNQPTNSNIVYTFKVLFQKKFTYKINLFMINIKYLIQNETYLCRRFTRFVTRYNLMTSQNLIVPIFESEDKPQLTQFINNNNSQDKVCDDRIIIIFFFSNCSYISSTTTALKIRFVYIYGMKN